MMVFDSHTIWAMSNEDANPTLVVIDTTAGTTTTYTADATPAHGGGLDDMQMIGGQVFTSASNPSLDTTTNLFDKPAIYTLTINAGGSTYHLTPVLMGNATAHVVNPSVAGVTVDASGNAMLGNPLVPNGSTNNPGGLQDPDSMAVDPSGNLVLDSQALFQPPRFPPETADRECERHGANRPALDGAPGASTGPVALSTAEPVCNARATPRFARRAL